MNKQQKLQIDIRILENEVEMLKESRINWMASSIGGFGFILVMLSIFLFIYPEEMGVYKQGFQDGQAEIMNNVENSFNQFCNDSLNPKGMNFTDNNISILMDFRKSDCPLKFEITNETLLFTGKILKGNINDSNSEIIVCGEGYKIRINERSIGCVRR